MRCRQLSIDICCLQPSSAANQLHVAAAVDPWDRQMGRQTNTVLLHKRSPLEVSLTIITIHLQLCTAPTPVTVLTTTTLLLHTLNGLFSGTTQVSRYQKGKTNLDFTGARDSEWQWHQLGSMQVCTSLQTDNHASTPPLRFLQAGCPSCRLTNSVKALKVTVLTHMHLYS